ncbi:YceI family protein [Chitinimonas sp. BJYL2]|uniref:YceI family protein n=1 Tax=Chitinimonas sp. BJYL2 TaxID=2976696 RepID=UPI0022B5C56C|nr:YceI family protein [Chitinimonas sp. BJYL2]
MPRILLSLFASLGLIAGASAAPVSYNIDPSHTYPSFEADHMGVSLWRGKFNQSTGKVVLDKAAGTGSVDISIDIGSVDFGHDAMNKKALSAELFDAAKFPQSTYRGKLAGFVNGAPTKVEGELTLRGVSKPVDLEIKRFKCIVHPMLKRELCGADAYATFQRDAFGIDAGKAWGFDMSVALRIQVEAVAAE